MVAVIRECVVKEDRGPREVNGPELHNAPDAACMSPEQEDDAQHGERYGEDQEG